MAFQIFDAGFLLANESHIGKLLIFIFIALTFLGKSRVALGQLLLALHQ